MNLLCRTLLVVTSAAFLFGAGSASAQCPVTSNVSYTPVSELSLADIDFQHFQSRSLLFTMQIGNSQPVVSASVNLVIDVFISLADGSYNGHAVHFESRLFAVPPGGRTLTNLNLGSAGDIGDSVFNFAQEAKDHVQDVALATGKFPAGTYTFNLVLQPFGCTPIASPPIVFTIVNATRVELRSPRDGETTNQFPLFEFVRDGVADAVLTVAEKAPDQSREDALAHRPPMLEADVHAATSFLYSTGRPLENGKTYVWNVVGKEMVAGGATHNVESTIGLFTVAADAGLSQNDMILELLAQMLGPRYAPLFDQIRTSGLSYNGHADLNGSQLSETDLLNLINELRAAADGIEVTLE